ncbi:CNNM domain-containing protein [Rubritalea marina]|uniref:CNNM domain-containing protein n=1 Tax=Rubritalea marina TaxID=361055 RepID=UPI0003823F52|nr:CNNM domain-containing protein [Rubritalea marina]
MELLIFYVVLALGVSFLCSVLEAVLLSVTPGFIQSELNLGKKYAVHLAHMKENVDAPLSAILTLNTIAHTMGAAGAGAQWKVLYNDTGEAIFASVLTLLVLVLSEIIPKTLGAKFWRALSGPTTSTLRFMIWVLTYLPPWPLPALKFITRLIGGHSGGDAVSRDELAAMADVASQSGGLENDESTILKNLLLFKSTQVRDIMTPRTVVYAARETTPLGEFLPECMKRPFSRIPIFGKDRDHITGFVLKSDLMSAQLKGEDEGKTLLDFARPIKATTNKESLYNVLKLMTREKQHLMLAVDEFGGMEGVITMEDVVETLLGMEIVDEADSNEDMQVLARNLWAQRAKSMGITIPEEEETTSANGDK